MAATFCWAEDNGIANGTPPRGTTRTGFSGPPYATDVNWKSVDDCTSNGGTLYSAAPITVGTNSYTKNQYGVFSGTITSISSCFWSARTDPPGPLTTGLKLVGTVSSNYTTPSTTANATLTTDYSSAPIAIGAGLPVFFSTIGPESAIVTATLSSPGYTQYLQTQLQTTSSAATGDTSAISTCLSFQEH